MLGKEICEDWKQNSQECTWNSILSQINLDHIFLQSFFKMCFNISLPPTLKSPKHFSQFSFPTKK